MWVETRKQEKTHLAVLGLDRELARDGSVESTVESASRLDHIRLDDAVLRAAVEKHLVVLEAAQRVDLALAGKALRVRDELLDVEQKRGAGARRQCRADLALGAVVGAASENGGARHLGGESDVVLNWAMCESMQRGPHTGQRTRCGPAQEKKSTSPREATSEARVRCVADPCIQWRT